MIKRNLIKASIGMSMRQRNINHCVVLLICIYYDR